MSDKRYRESPRERIPGAYYYHTLAEAEGRHARSWTPRLDVDHALDASAGPLRG